VTRTARAAELEIVGSYRLPYEAELGRSALEAYGVPAWVMNDTRVREALTHNIRLAVRRQDAELARELLAGDHSADIEAIPEASLPPEPSEICPSCGASQLEWTHTVPELPRRWLTFMAPLFARERSLGSRLQQVRRCLACGRRSQ
jgi:hypothetical protein